MIQVMGVVDDLLPFMTLALFSIPIILIIVWTAQDAKSRGLPGYLVGILVAFSGPVGMILWLVIRPKRPVNPPAPNQEAEAESNRPPAR